MRLDRAGSRIQALHQRGEGTQVRVARRILQQQMTMAGGRAHPWPLGQGGQQRQLEAARDLFGAHATVVVVAVDQQLQALLAIALTGKMLQGMVQRHQRGDGGVGDQPDFVGLVQQQGGQLP